MTLSLAFRLMSHCRDFPGGPVAKNLPSIAGDVGWMPGWGTKILRATGQLSPCAPARESPCTETTKPCAPEPEAHVPQEEASALQLEKSPCDTRKTQHSYAHTHVRTCQSQTNPLCAIPNLKLKAPSHSAVRSPEEQSHLDGKSC